MHIGELNRILRRATREVEAGTMDGETAKQILRLSGAELKRWKAQMEHVKRNHTVEFFPDLNMTFDCRGKDSRWIRHSSAQRRS